MKWNQSGVAVVVSGGGARGAYEAGVLSVLLPKLEKQGLTPSIFLGTSAGAINAVAFAAMSHLSAEEAAKRALKLWMDVRSTSVFRSPLGAMLSSTRSGPRRATGLLDTSPLAKTMGEVINWDQLHHNVDEGHVSVGVVATACSTRRSSVFLECAPGVKRPSTSFVRAIDYFPTRLEPRHIMASSAIPVAFPAVEVRQPFGADDWYVDGGLRLNTPLKPAVDLEAKRLVIVATDPSAPHTNLNVPDRPAPSAGGGVAQLLYAIMTDRMVEDVRTLARKNEKSRTGETDHDRIPWLFAGPEPGSAGPLAALAGEVVRGRSPTQRRRRAAVRLLQRSAGGWLARDPGRLEVLTHLFFDPEFIEGAIELGRRDAQRSLDGLGSPCWQQEEGVPGAAMAPVGAGLN